MSPDKVMLTHMGPSPEGGFELGLRDGEEGGVLHLLAAGLADMMQLDSDKPLNCIQMDVEPAGRPRLTLTLQRANGKAPLIMKAEAVNLLRQTLEAIDTGRSEPLFIMRDAIRNWLADDINASAIETRRAEMRSSSVEDESAAPKADAQPLSSEHSS